MTKRKKPEPKPDTKPEKTFPKDGIPKEGVQKKGKPEFNPASGTWDIVED